MGKIEGIDFSGTGLDLGGIDFAGTDLEADQAGPDLRDSQFGNDEIQGRSGIDTAKDIGLSLVSGAIEVPKGILGLADLAATPARAAYEYTTGNPAGTLTQGAANIGVDFERAQGILSDEKSDSSREQRTNVNQEFDKNGVLGGLGALYESPAVAFEALAESVPGMATLAGATKVFALRIYQQAAQTAVAGGASAEAAAVVGREAVTAALPKLGAISSSLEGAQAAGSAAATDAADGDLSGRESVAAAGAGISTAVIGRLVNNLGAKIGLDDVDTLIATRGMRDAAGNIFSGAAKGTLKEALEEAPQSGSEQAWSNFGDNKPLGEGVAQAATEGGVVGGLMGLGGGGLGAIGNKGRPDIDRMAAEAGEAAKARGGDNLDVMIAQQQVYWNAPAGQSGQLPGNMIDFESSRPGALDEKAGAIEKAMADFQRQKEDDSYRSLPPGREPLDPVRLDDLSPAKPVLQEVHEAVVSGLEAQLNVATKRSGPTNANDNAGKSSLPMQDRELLHAIASRGGLNQAEAEAQGIDPAEFSRQEGGLARVFKKNGGMSFDQMAEELSQDGFFGDEPYTANGLLDKVNQSLTGNPVYSPKSSEAAGRQASQQEADLIQQTIAQYEQDAYEDQDSPPKGSIFNSGNDDEKRVGYAILEADLAGVDGYIVDYILKANLSDTETEEALKGAVANVKQLREGLRSPRQTQGDSAGNQTAPRGQGITQEVGGQAAQQSAGAQPAEVAPLTKTLDERLDDLVDERETVDKNSPLYSAMKTASSPAWSEEQAQQAIIAAIESGRSDVADMIVERSQRGADTMSTTPGVSTDNPKYEAIKKDLEDRKKDKQREAKQLANLAKIRKTIASNTTESDFSLTQETEEQRYAREKREQGTKTEAAPAVPGAENFTLSTGTGTAGEQVQPSTGAQSDLLGGGFKTRGQAQEIDTKANAAASSPQNDRNDPSPAQIAADNYKKGEPFTLHGQKIVIENPRGSMRGDKETGGKKWQNKMAAHYGDIKGTVAADGDNLDVFVGQNPESDKIFVIDQEKEQGYKGGFDEHKVMLGFSTMADAIKAYKDSYDKGWGVGAVRQLTPEQFKEWVANGDHTKPIDTQIIQPGAKANETVEAPKSDNPDEFISAPDGSIDFGEISDEQAKAIGRQSGKVRLQIGEHTGPHKGFGRIHIEAEHPEIGNVVDFVTQVAAEYDTIYRGNQGRLRLVKSGSPDTLLVVELQPSTDGDFYSVISAYKSRKNSGEPLWSAAQSRSADSGNQPALSDTKSSEAGKTSSSAKQAAGMEDSTSAAEIEQSKSDTKQANRAKLDTVAEQQAKAKAEKELSETLFKEEFEDEAGNTVIVEQSALDRVRQLNKRIEVCDKLLECLKT